jgi:hypothetical protein
VEDPPQHAEPPPPSDDVISPSELPVDVKPSPPPYPRRFVDRPLVLPRGVNELSVSANAGLQSVADYELTYGGASAGASFGFTTFEINLGVYVIPLYADNRVDVPDDVPLFQKLSASVLWRLPAELYAGVQGVLGNVGHRRQRYSPSIFVGHRFRPSELTALTVSAGLDSNFGHEVRSDEVYSTRVVGGYGTASGLLQLTPTMALRVSGTVAQYKYFDDHHHSTNDTYRVVQGGGALLLSVSETVDLSPSFSASSAGEVVTVGGGMSLSIRSR